MQTLIHKEPSFQFPPINPNVLLSRTRRKHDDFLRIHPKRFRYTSKTLRLSSAVAPQSPSYGGWDDSQLDGDSVNYGELNHFYNFLSSIGVYDKKYVFVYLSGFVCALTISRVKVSTILVFPVSAIVFALGFLIGLVKGGYVKELKSNDIRKRLVGNNLRGFIEKLGNFGDNLKGYNAEVLDVKNGIRRSIERNQITVSDLEGYIDVIESVDICLGNTIELVESYMQSVLGGNKENEGVSGNDSSKRTNMSVDNIFNFFRRFDGLFGWKFGGQKSRKVESSGNMELSGVEERKNGKLANILVAPVEKVNLNSALNADLENKRGSMLDDTLGSTVRAENYFDATDVEKIAVENKMMDAAEINDTTSEAFFNQTIYSHRNNTSKFVNNQKVHFKDYKDKIETMPSNKNSCNPLDVIISRSTLSFSSDQQKHEALNGNYLHLQNKEEDQQEYHRNFYTRRPPFTNQESAHDSVFGSRSSALGLDLEFDRYLSEANNLLEEAKGCLARKIDDIRAEQALQKSASLLVKAIDMRPMSLLAVGLLGNTYLLHGELKLGMSRELRSLLVRTDPLLDGELGKVLEKFDVQFTNKDEIISALVNACEKCEELLIQSGRKYKLALSIDGNDTRALYNWGLALTFRAQLIADIGPSAAGDADKIFVSAIENFDAMISRSYFCAPDALFRWGAALQHISRLRPSRSREKVKLLQQARRLYEDALHMDLGNRPLEEALSSCISELDYWYR
ncbi:hypothetical protein OROGR_003176 [Orobanche gracilis]